MKHPGTCKGKTIHTIDMIAGNDVRSIAGWKITDDTI